MFISHPSVYLDAISLIANDQSNVSRGAVSNILKLAENAKDNGSAENEICQAYGSLLKNLLDKNITKDKKDEMRLLLLKYKQDPRLKDDKLSYDLLLDMLLSDTKMTKLEIENKQETLEAVTLWNAVNDIYKKGFSDLYSAQHKASPREQIDAINQLIDKAATMREISRKVVSGKQSFPGLIQSIDMTNEQDLLEAFSTNDTIVRRGGFRLGLQGITRMFGQPGGPVRGESVCFNALTHNYKSYMLMSVARWICQYNDPPVVAEGKKPLLWFVSLENEAWRNAVWVLRTLYENATGEFAPDDDKVIIDFAKAYFLSKGWYLVIDRFLPETFGTDEFKRRYENLESMGYEIIAAIVDYVGKMKVNPSLSRDQQVKELYSIICNYTKTKNTMYVTAHQLNRKAAELVSTGTANVVRKFTVQYLADSIESQKEVDFVMFLHKVVIGPKAYLTASREGGKHRYVDNTPVEDQYTAYEFTPRGLMDDLDKEDQSIKDIYAASMDSVESAEFNDLGLY